MIIGIDLGTTNSLVSYFTEEGPKIIPNRFGKNLTPSVVSIDENNEIYIGETARERELLYPHTTASVFKRDMGNNRKFTLGDKEFTAEELSSFVLRALRDDAEDYLKETITEAVVSVPAYFNDIRRKATKRAGELAGLKVERIISEPTAAAIAYGLYQNKTNGKFLVFDLGGGTFDVSILELYNSIVEVRAVAGDNYLGGEDFTAVIEELFFKDNKYIEKDKLSEKNIKQIHNQAESSKLELSEQDSSIMRCSIDGKEIMYTVEITAFEKACEDLLNRIRQPIKKSLSDANIRIKDIHKVVLVGGATKNPIIRRFVSKLFRTIPDTTINPDEAVALGAGIQGAMKERDVTIREVILTDVCPFTLGTEVVLNLEDGEMEAGHFCPIIERNTTIPASRTERLYTVCDNQQKICVNILQGESRFAENNLSLGEMEIELPKAKAGQEAVDVTYTYDINAILEVVVQAVTTKKMVKQVVKGQNINMTEEEIQQRLEDLSYLKIHPKEKEVNKLLLLRGERLYEEALSMDRVHIDRELHKFEQALQTQDQAVIEQARNSLKNTLDEIAKSY